MKGMTALVTGASNGLGVDFARDLAARGADLVLVARREPELNAVADEIRSKHGVTVHVIPMDLGAPDAPEQLYARTSELGLQIDVLVNNAGFGVYGTVVDIPWERERAMLQLDVLTLVGLTKLYARDMVARKRGYVLQVASIGAYQPSPTYAAYSAAKSFVLYFGEALAYELRGTGVSCTVVSPGVTRTAFLEVSGQQPTLFQRWSMMESPDVARQGIEAMLARKPSVVTGWMNATTAWFMGFLPRQLAAAMAWRTMTSGGKLVPASP